MFWTRLLGADQSSSQVSASSALILNGSGCDPLTSSGGEVGVTSNDFQLFIFRGTTRFDAAAANEQWVAIVLDQQ
jgi:hypothetical protein